MKFKPCLVTCIDISTKQGWINQEECDSFISDESENIVYQAGFLYEQDEKQVVLLNSYFHNQDLLGDVTKIPRGCIIEITML